MAVIGNLNIILKNGEKVSCVYGNDAQLTNKEFVIFLKNSWFKNKNLAYFALDSEIQSKILSKLTIGRSEKASFTYNFDTNINKVLKLDCKFNPITRKFARGKLLETFYIN